MKLKQEHLKIELSGSFDKKKSYVFETYRLAVKLNITGYVKRCNEQEIEIVASGSTEAIQSFVSHLKDLCGEIIKINSIKNKQDIAYHEFRILSGCKDGRPCVSTYRKIKN